MLDEILDEQMKDRIIRGGNGAARVGFSLFRDALVGQMMRVLQQLVG